MKKIWKILVPLFLAIVMVFTLSGIALADDPTDTYVTWDGAGLLDVEVETGDTTSAFQTAGSTIFGTFSATDANNNPYNYQVDSFSSTLQANVAGSGYIQAYCNRVDSYSPMYGPAGQLSWSNVWVNDGLATMAYRTTTNFAQMTDASYGNQLPGGHNIVVADTDYYEINRGIADGRGNSGWLYADGDGDATLDCMVSGASGVWDLQFGRGGGSYTDANFSATGNSGTFEVEGEGNNSITFNGMGISSGGGTLGFIANWVNSFSIADYSLTAN